MRKPKMNNKAIKFVIRVLLICITSKPHLLVAAETTPEIGVKAEKSFTNLYRNNLNNLLNILDEDIDACEDYFQHACGYFNEYMAGISVLDDYENEVDDYVKAKLAAATAADVNVPPFLYNKEDRMHFFEQHKEEFRTWTGVILKDLYNDCKERFRVNVLQSELKPQWQRMLDELPFLAKNAHIYANQWPFLHFQWMKLNRHIEFNWMHLAAEFAAHGIPSIFNIFFAEGTIFISPLDDMKCESLNEIKESLLPLLSNGQRSPQIADIISNEVWTFCRLLTGKLSVTDNGTGENSSSDDDGDEIFKDDTTIAYFQHFFGRLNFTESELEGARKIPIDRARLRDILILLRSTESRIIYNFVLWHAYAILKHEDCFLLTEEFETFLLSEYWNWNVLEPYFRRDVAMATYLYQTTRFQQHRKQLLLSESWDKFLFGKLQRKDFNIERLIKQYAATHLNAENLSEIYGRLPLEPGAFYANLLILGRLQLRASFFQEIIDAEDFNHPAYFLRQFLDFSILMVKQPLFHYFATQGFDLWHESQLLQSTDGVYTALDCLERQTLLHHQEEDSSIFSVLSMQEVKQIFLFYRSFAEAFRDYHFWLEGESFAFAEDFVLEYFKMDSPRIIFYAVAQLYCGRNDRVYRTLINRSFMNMPEFQVAFNCSAEADMNPQDKCMIKNCV